MMEAVGILICDRGMFVFIIIFPTLIRGHIGASE
jgi:hypothetical protein